MRLGNRQREALRAVAEGAVYYVHPSQYAVPLRLLELRPYRVWWIALLRLEQKQLIRAEAGSAEYHKPIHMTDAGRKALAEARG